MFSSLDTWLHPNQIILVNSKCTIQWISIAIFNLKIRSATSFCSFFSIASFWRRTLEILLTLSILLSDVLNSLLTTKWQNDKDDSKSEYPGLTLKFFFLSLAWLCFFFTRAQWERFSLIFGLFFYFFYYPSPMRKVSSRCEKNKCAEESSKLGVLSHQTAGDQVKSHNWKLLSAALLTTKINIFFSSQDHTTWQIVHMNNKHITSPTNQEWHWKTPHLLCKWNFKVKPNRSEKI